MNNIASGRTPTHLQDVVVPGHGQNCRLGLLLHHLQERHVKCQNVQSHLSGFPHVVFLVYVLITCGNYVTIAVIECAQVYRQSSLQVLILLVSPMDRITLISLREKNALVWNESWTEAIKDFDKAFFTIKHGFLMHCFIRFSSKWFLVFLVVQIY